MTNSLLLKMAIEIVDLPIDSMAIFNIYVSLPEGRYFGGFWDSSHSSSIPLWMWAGQFKATCHPNSSGILMPIAFGTKAFTGSLRCISTSYHVSWLKSPFYWLCLFMFPCVSQDSNFPSWIPHDVLVHQPCAEAKEKMAVRGLRHRTDPFRFLVSARGVHTSCA